MVLSNFFLKLNSKVQACDFFSNLIHCWQCPFYGVPGISLALIFFQNHKILLTQAVEDGDLPSVKEMLYYESVLEKGLETCLADCRCSVSEYKIQSQV